jgi:hypothetical protein
MNFGSIVAALSSLCFGGSGSAQAVRELVQGAVPQVVDEDWSDGIARKIAREEYRFTAFGAGVFSAPNRALELRACVSTEGLEVFPRSVSADGEGAPWRLRLRTRGFGRLDRVLRLQPPALSSHANRAELDHGLLREWFENRADGLEQGWTIPSRPAGFGPLCIGLTIEGDLEFRLDAGARSGILVDRGGVAVLRYRGLRAFDAAGSELAARMAPGPEGLLIEVDDAGAAYPLTVDPILTGPAWTVESDQADATLGYSVATAGDVNGDGFSDVIVGAHNYDNGENGEGRAYVYHGGAGGLASSPSWTIEGDLAGAGVGFSVATAGDVNGDGYSDVITRGGSLSASAFVYHGGAGGLATTASWTVSQPAAVTSVATAGDVNGDGYSDVVIGTPFANNGQTLEGRAFVFQGGAGGLATSAAWSAEGNQDFARFGVSVATAGDVNGDGYSDVIVGATMFDNVETDEGAAFVYLGGAGGLASNAAWTAESDQASASFGYPVGTAGDVNGDGYSDVIVGAELFDNGQTNEGRAFVYLGGAGGLETSASWNVEADQAEARSGFAAATAGDVNGDGYSDVIVGARLFDNGESNEGRAQVHLGSAAGLATSPVWSSESNLAGASFGFSVAPTGDVNGDGYSDVIVSAAFYTNGESFEGGAFLYLGGSEGPRVAGWNESGSQFGARFGASVAVAGDVNGDGYGDVVVGAPLFDNGQTDEGAAFLYLGSGAGLASTPAWSGESDQAGASFGSSVAKAGDVNGDGYGDVIVGAPLYDNGEVDEGRALVYLGSATGLPPGPAWTAESDQVGAQYGGSATSAGDVNGDGYGDVIVGAPLFDNGQTDEGRALVYLGSGSGLAPTPAWMAEVDQVGANFGWSVSSAGDVNADGYGDVIVGAPLFDNGELDEGRAFAYPGSPLGPASVAAWTAEEGEVGAQFGYSVASAGDVNGDGYSDVIVGAPLNDVAFSGADEGGARIFHGSAAGLPSLANLRFAITGTTAHLGWSVSAAGDMNSDGYGDVIVGAPGFDFGNPDVGLITLVPGSAGGLVLPSSSTFVGSGAATLQLGYSVAAGDTNGDGYSDSISGRPGAETVSEVSGNGGRGGWLRSLGQRRANDSAPIALLGRPSRDGLFRIQAGFAKNLTGFSWAAPGTPLAFLEWEVKPLGVPFDGMSIERSAVGAPLYPPGGMATLNELTAAGLLPPKLRLAKAASFHWRARIATNNPLFPNTAWFGLQGNNITEAKLRKTPSSAP